ncbi:hypothetical protein GUJ93_ZPchr0006g41691 [Zizania palustris]|uniref:Uncharacterized protein n=1 Tax=Zizania palustris TaxID=103762 RepID=A0A8J5T8F4_ZIZPA|nr:hypothetical protein GUJ93_ZPchr0006g41691 [Zizania palustris]
MEQHKLRFFTLLVVLCLVLASTVADARLLKLAGKDDVALVVEAPAVDIQTVVGSTERDGGESDAGSLWRGFVVTIDMLRGIKDSGPSPGAGH